MSTAILDRRQRRSDEGYSSTISPVRPGSPAGRGIVGRPATRETPTVLPVPRAEVGCAGAVGGPTLERGYRMGRWARLTVTLSVLATALVVLFGGSSNSTSGTIEVVSTPGQTVWSIARTEAGSAASPQVVGAFADQVRTLNGLETTGLDEVLTPGLVLQIPAG